MSFEDKGLINLIITGVGGQGIPPDLDCLERRSLEEATQSRLAKPTVPPSEGSVASHVRISRERIPYSPVTPRGKADIILGPGTE